MPWVDTLLYGIWFLWHNNYSRHTLILLFWGQLKLYELRWWRQGIYGIYMRVSLFGLFPWRINLMNSQFELVQLVLSIFTPNILLNVSFIWLCVPIFTTWFSMHAQIYQYTCTYLISDSLLIYDFHFKVYWSLPILVCLNHITWSCTRVTAWERRLTLSYVLVGLLFNNPGPSCPDLGAWTMGALL